jgi:hypothetical protein
MYLKTRLQLKKLISASLRTSDNYERGSQKYTITSDDKYVVPITNGQVFGSFFKKCINNTALGVKYSNMGNTTYVPQRFPN